MTYCSKAAPASVNDNHRIEPGSLPVRFSAQCPGRRVGSERRLPGSMTVHLAADRVTLDRTVANGLPIRLSLALGVFEGVAACIEPVAGSNVTYVRLELMHRDPSLSVPLSRGTDFDAVASDWQAWSRQLDLPMLLVEADGSIVRAPDCDGAIAGTGPTTRRKNHGTIGRRGRFQRRRKTGGAADGRVVAGEREIIART